MKIYKISQENKITTNPLDGKSNEQARNIVRKLVAEPSKGFFRDEYWNGPNAVFSALNKANIDYSIESTKYDKYSQNKSNVNAPNDYKEWIFVIKFTNNKSRETILNCAMTAYGAGGTAYPLERYDLTVLIN